MTIEQTNVVDVYTQCRENALELLKTLGTIIGMVYWIYI